LGVFLKKTVVEGLALDDKTKYPLQGVGIRIFVFSEQKGYEIIQETLTDNNGYFLSSFEAKEESLFISPCKKGYFFSGTYSILSGMESQDGETVKYGQKQYFTFELHAGIQRKRVQTATGKVNMKVFAVAFMRKIVLFPFWKHLFSK
jgi:hypothetical protein